MRRTILLAASGLSLYAASMLIAYLIGIANTEPADRALLAQYNACETAVYSVLRDKLWSDDQRQACGEALDYCNGLLEECR